MATVINVPKDTRFEGIGRGLGEGVAAFFDERKKQKKAARFKDAIDSLMTEPRGLDADEDIAEEEPTEAQIERGLERVPKSDVDLPSIAEIVGAFGEFLEPGDIANIILAPKLAKLRRTPPQTPSQVKATSKARRAGTLEADTEIVTQLTASMEAATAAKNPRRAKTIRKQIEKLTGKGLKTIEKEAEAKKTGELTARRTNIETILSSLTREAPESRATTATVFSGTDKASTDATAAVDLFIQARALTMSGESALANSLITQANFLMDNSPAIAKQREMNKPISAALAAELQVPVGTTLGEVSRLTPRSPEQVTQATSEASALGRGIVKARQDLGFINEARGTISGLQKKLVKDPGLVGIRGTLRAKGKTVVGILDDFGLTDFVGDATEIAAMASGKDAGLIASLVADPTLSVLDIIENSVGLILARLQTPDQRIPVEVIKRAIALVKLRGLTSSGQVIDRLVFIDGLLSSREENIRQSFNLLPEEGSVIEPSELLPEERPSGMRQFKIQNGRLVEITDG